MVILITGASHTGKTVLAQRLIDKFRFSCLSIDHLKMGLIRSGNTTLTPEDDDELTPYLWPIVSEMIKTAIENGQNLIVEGCYVPFDWSSSFTGEYLQSIRFICLAMTDAYIDANLDLINKHSCAIESRLEDAACTAEELKRSNNFYAKGFGSVTLINDDFNAALNSVVENLR